MATPFQGNLKLLGLMLLAGAFGGVGSFLWSMYLGAPLSMTALPGLSIQGSTFVLCIMLGCISAAAVAAFGDTTNAFKSVAFAVIAGFCWKPVLEAVQARVQAQGLFEAQRSTGELKDKAAALSKAGPADVGTVKDAAVRVVETLPAIPVSGTTSEAARNEVGNAVKDIASSTASTEDRVLALTAVTEAAQKNSAPRLAEQALEAARSVVAAEPDPVKRARYTVTLNGVQVGPGAVVTLPPIVIPRPTATPSGD